MEACPDVARPAGLRPWTRLEWKRLSGNSLAPMGKGQMPDDKRSNRIRSFPQMSRGNPILPDLHPSGSILAHRISRARAAKPMPR